MTLEYVMMSAVDILDVIDAAVGGCQECGGSLAGSPSDDFCGDGCQQAWHAARADELVGYREPWDRPEDFPPGVIPLEAFEDELPLLQLLPMRSADAIRLQFAAGLEEGIRAPAAPVVTSSLGLLQVSWDPRPAEFRLPRSTGNLAADWRAARAALLDATTDEQRAAVRLRMESLAERQRAADLEHAEAVAQALTETAERLRVFFGAFGEAVRKTAEAVRPVFEALRQAAVVEEPLPADPWERALAARLNRNTGPQQQRRRPPRSLGRPRTHC